MLACASMCHVAKLRPAPTAELEKSEKSAKTEAEKSEKSEKSDKPKSDEGTKDAPEKDATAAPADGNAADAKASGSAAAKADEAETSKKTENPESKDTKDVKDKQELDIAYKIYQNLPHRLDRLQILQTLCHEQILHGFFLIFCALGRSGTQEPPESDGAKPEASHMKKIIQTCKVPVFEHIWSKFISLLVCILHTVYVLYIYMFFLSEAI